MQDCKGCRCFFYFLFVIHFTADAEIGEQMRFGDTVRTPDFETADTAAPQNFIAGFGADAENLADLFYAQNIEILFQHDLVSVTL